MPRVLRPRSRRASTLRDGTEAEPRSQIELARPGQQLLLALDDIEPNPRNPRRTFSQDGLNQLAESMKRDGQIQPIVVRRAGTTWQIIAGERRWRAARLAGLERLAAVQRDATDESAFRLALVENIHREDLSHQEKVEALDMLGEIAATQGLRRAAGELNMSPGWLSRRLSMRRDPVVFPALEEGRITFAQANELLSAPAVTRPTLLDRLLRSRRSVPSAEVRKWVRDVRQQIHQQQQRMIAVLAEADGASDGAASGVADFSTALEYVRRVPPPTDDRDRAALVELTAYVQELLERVRSEDGEGQQDRPRATRGRGQRAPRRADQTTPSKERT